MRYIEDSFTAWKLLGFQGYNRNNRTTDNYFQG